MPYKVIIEYEDGTKEEEEEVFDTEKEAYNHGIDICACIQEGAETLHMSNSGDYPDEEVDVNFEIEWVDE